MKFLSCLPEPAFNLINFSSDPIDGGIVLSSKLLQQFRGIELERLIDKLRNMKLENLHFQEAENAKICVIGVNNDDPIWLVKIIEKKVEQLIVMLASEF